MSVPNQFDQLARRLAQSSHSRRATLGALGGGLMATLAAGRPTPATAQATPTGPAPLDQETISNLAQALWLPPNTTFAELPADIQEQVLDPKNSNAAFGQRMRYYFQFLLDNPDSFTPDYTDRYRTLMDYTDELSAHQAYVMTSFVGRDRSNGYDPIPGAANFVFPDTNGMQLRSQVGWYFAVGSAWDRAGAEYGIELMFFRTAILPPPIARQLGLTDAENQVLELQLALTRAGETHYQATPVTIAGTTGLLSFADGAIGATLGNNAFTQLNPDAPFPLRIQARGWDQTAVNPVELGVDITFVSGRDYLLQGADGCLPCCGGVGTLYYSIPNLELDPGASTITIDGEEITLTSGSFWFDHQWTNGLGASNARSEGIRALGNLSPAGQGGWDWFMAQFEGNRQITLAAIHTNDNAGFYKQDGPTAPGTMVAPAIGKLMDETGEVIDVAGTVTIDEWIRSETTPTPALTGPPTSGIRTTGSST